MSTSTARSDAFISTDREKSRLATLRSQYVLDSTAKTAFETLAHMARLVTGCPISLVSLVDEETQVFKAACGWKLEGTPRDVSFCTHAVEADEILEVCDALSDPRFRTNPLVTQSPNIRYYLGIPIRGFNRLPIGTLCVIDERPRLPLRDAELEGLVQLARAVESLMEQSRELRMRQAQLQDIEADLDAVEEAIESQTEIVATTVAAVRSIFGDIERALGHGPDIDVIEAAIRRGRNVTAPFVPVETAEDPWPATVRSAVQDLLAEAARRKIALDFDYKEFEAALPPKSARRIVHSILRASIFASPNGATVGIRLKADPYFVCVSIYRESAGLQIVKPGVEVSDSEVDPMAVLAAAQEKATESMIAVGGHLESKAWQGGTVLKAWFPRPEIE